MVHNEIVELIRYKNSAVDEDGNDVPIKVARQVYAIRQSIGQKEFFEAGQKKLTPAFVLLVFSGDYFDEREVVVDGKTYSIYRTFEPTKPKRTAVFPINEYIELYCEERVSND